MSHYKESCEFIEAKIKEKFPRINALYVLSGTTDDWEAGEADIASSLLWMMENIAIRYPSNSRVDYAGRGRWMGWIYALAEYKLMVIDQRKVHELSKLDCGCR